MKFTATLVSLILYTAVAGASATLGDSTPAAAPGFTGSAAIETHVLAVASNPGSKGVVSFNDVAATHPFGGKLVLNLQPP
ncbi:hypothetical protein BC629DRAFT_1595307 [Irpex lacteus]|nr:hypothetical protein BC629DRAFT_1595307 [Irpex lacteus]